MKVKLTKPNFKLPESKRPKKRNLVEDESIQQKRSNDDYATENTNPHSRKKASGRFSRLHSLQVKVMILVAIGIIASIYVMFQVMMNYMKDLLIDSSYGKMLNVATSYGKVIDNAESEIETFLKTEEYGNILADISVEGVEHFSYMVLNKSGMITYHSDETKNNTPNRIPAITELVASIAKGHIPENMCTVYEDKETGETMYMSYYITGIRAMVIVCASSDELLKPIAELRTISIILGLAFLAIGMVIASFVIRRITKPLNQVTAVINDTAKLKLKLPEYMDVLCARKDEAGLISRAVKEMSAYLHEVVLKIDDANNNISTNMGKLEVSSNEVHTLCMDNSATIEQLAANTVQVNNMTQLMNDHMTQMRRKAEEISKETEKSNEASDVIAGRAQNMQNSTRDAIIQTKKMYELIKDKTQVAVEGLKSVAKINELTKAIVEVSDQTSLLSLNASIEAARAGEAGRGFSVVATEISKLANRSLETVKDINQIIKEVNLAVTNITTSMEETSKFLENTVLTDYDHFNGIGEQYMNDAVTFRSGMDNISCEIEALNSSIHEIALAVENIYSAVGETTAGVNDIAEKTTGVVHVTSDNYDLTNDTIASVDELREIIRRFEF